MGSLRFKDHDALRDAMESIGGYTVANVAELGSALTADDLTALDSWDLAQLRYWNPSTVEKWCSIGSTERGALIFMLQMANLWISRNFGE